MKMRLVAMHTAFWSVSTENERWGDILELNLIVQAIGIAVVIFVLLSIVILDKR